MTKELVFTFYGLTLWLIRNSENEFMFVSLGFGKILLYVLLIIVLGKFPQEH